MISIIHLISAKGRLANLDATIYYMGKDVPSLLLAQRDMLIAEIDFYKERVRTIMLTSVVLAIPVTTILLLNHFVK
jgi:hypothetical protein